MYNREKLKDSPGDLCSQSNRSPEQMMQLSQTSASKTVAIMIKGSMNKSRLPIIKINDQNIKYVGQHKYLRIIVDRRFTFIVHARYLRSKVTQFVMTIRRIAEKWRIKTDMLKTLYGAAAFPIIRYGSLLWYDVANKTLIKRNLLAL